MPAELSPPSSLNHLKYFILRCYREAERFELIEPGKAQSYTLGNPFKTRAYFERIGLAYLGGRAMDSAWAFGASQALIVEQRAWGLDLTRIDLESGQYITEEEAYEKERLAREDEEAGDDVFVCRSQAHGD